MSRQSLSNLLLAMAAVAGVFSLFALSTRAKEHFTHNRTTSAATEAPKFVTPPSEWGPSPYPGFSYATHAYGYYSNAGLAANPVYTGSYNASVDTVPQPIYYLRPESPGPVWGFPYYSGGYYDTWRQYQPWPTAYSPPHSGWGSGYAPVGGYPPRGAYAP